jgi:hypothetical protein
MERALPVHRRILSAVDERDVEGTRGYDQSLAARSTTPLSTNWMTAIAGGGSSGTEQAVNPVTAIRR